MLRVARNDAEKNNIAFKSLDVVRQCASKLFKTAESGVDKVVSSCEKNPSVHWRYMNFLRQRKTALDAPLYAVSAGRSMIEMLGVLAIIAVLTVGGIAGYSKAIEKWKENKVIGEYSYLMQGIIEHLNDFEKLHGEKVRYDLLPTLSAMNLIPSNWKNAADYDGHKNVSDVMGNTLSVFSRSNRVVITILFGSSSVSESGNVVSQTFSKQLCKAFWQNILVPLHEHLYYAGVFCNNSAYRHNYFYNDKYCGEDRQCFSKITLSDIERICRTTAADEEYCVLTWEFDY